MIPLTLTDIAEAVRGTIVAGDPNALISGVAETDSRLVEAGGLFFALRGESTDGHRFVEQAVDRGASLVVTEHEVPSGGSAQIVVANGYDALAALAHAVVGRVRALGQLKVVGITGSNGKTSTKNMLRTILEAQGETIAPQGSFNNHVGAPISMLRITERTRFLVVEMGASGMGHIARLVRIAEPDVGVVLKVGLAHAGEFGGIEMTQRAKSEMVTDLPSTATAVLNADDDRVMAMRALTAARVVTFGTAADADYHIGSLTTDRTGTAFTLTNGADQVQVRLAILGEHHAMNATAALAVAHEWGVPLDDGARALSAMTRAERWRMELLQGGPDEVTIINDAYNASPDSMAAALRTLAQIAGPGERTIAVLGEMAELGEFSQEEHDRIGRLAVRLGIHQLVVVGAGAAAMHQAATLEGSWDGESVYFADPDAAADAVERMLRPGDLVLVKSSKSAGLRFLGDRIGGVTA
ncbi:UDP-N-acetylmuramoyl-tripeptide--D-alanyl-D-alanine ligase [Curtobacterium ammoniigenes]|uniref:UDP-N-acetylmuramoyl-tripeptide--D-alanyl-D- alanine ligase n=1 Tax=Curtobacterium ammoniigenes TaxID=395387 RepID=UPI000833645B|nr:UDP-N-acetylmuramoyl-tripeptide--D-alanyl-D-alanine ligase [Curtobacterium ammoniigenes]